MVLSRQSLAVVFLDRDGTINVDPGYLSDPEKVKLFDGAAEAIETFNSLGMRVIIVSNQSGIGRGYFTEEALRAVNDRLTELLEEGGAFVDALYFCPHRPDEGCGCRKPATGMVSDAASEFFLDMEKSYVVGDKASDMELARNIKAVSVLVTTGLGAKTKDELTIAPDHIAADLLSAARWIEEDYQKGHG